MSLFPVGQHAKQLYFKLGRWSAIQRLTRNYQGRAVCLMYHRVVPDEAFDTHLDPTLDFCVSTSSFDRQMKFLTTRFRPMPIDQVMGAMGPSPVNGDAIPAVVTFDDGYLDNLTYALPVLQKYRIPAVVYITTRFPEGHCEIWWLELWEIIKRRNRLRFVWQDRSYGYETATADQKFGAYSDVAALFMRLEKNNEAELLSVIRGSDEAIDFASLLMNWRQLKTLSADPLITIGAHGHSHTRLKTLPQEGLDAEIQDCCVLLTERLGVRVDHFSYPYGTLDQAGAREYRAVQAAGLKSAVTTLCHPFQDHHVFDIPRIGMADDDVGDKLQVKTSGWHLYWKERGRSKAAS